MGYRIEYDSHIGKYEVKKDYAGKFTLLVLGVCVLLAVGTVCFWPEGADAIRSFLIPGEDTVTLQAFQNMTNDLRSGATLGDAVYVFCRYVIHGA